MWHIPVWVVREKKYKEDFTMKKSIYEQMGGTYRREGDYLIPNISVPDTKEHNIGKYGNIHKQFLKENYPVYYSVMLSSGNLFARLERVERKAQQELDRLIHIPAKQQGVTEQLKTENQLKWTGLMNNIKAQVEEMVLENIVYVRKQL